MAGCTEVGVAGCDEVGVAGCNEVGVAGCNEVGVAGCTEVGVAGCNEVGVAGCGEVGVAGCTEVGVVVEGLAGYWEMVVTVGPCISVVAGPRISVVADPVGYAKAGYIEFSWTRVAAQFCSSCLLPFGPSECAPVCFSQPVQAERFSIPEFLPGSSCTHMLREVPGILALSGTTVP